jgi:hypothetical protein
VGVEQHGDAAAAQLRQQVAHDPAPDRIQGARRLVEQQQARAADQRLRDPQALLHSLRHGLHTPPALVAEADQPQQLDALGRAAGRARQALVQAQQLVGRRPAGEAEELGQVAERAPRGRRSGWGTAHPHGPARRPDEARGALDEGRLARAVGAQEADELGLADGQVDAAQRGGGAVALGQIADLERGRHERRWTIAVRPSPRIRRWP